MTAHKNPTESPTPVPKGGGDDPAVLAAAVYLQRTYRKRRYRRKRAALKLKSNSNKLPVEVDKLPSENTHIEQPAITEEARTKEESYVCASQIQAIIRGRLTRKQNLLPTKTGRPDQVTVEVDAKTNNGSPQKQPPRKHKHPTIRKAKKANDDVHLGVAEIVLQVLSQLDLIFRSRSIRIRNLMQTEDKRYQEKVRPVTLQRAIQAATAGYRPKFKAADTDLVMKQLGKNAQGLVDVKELESLMLFARRYRINQEKLGNLQLQESKKAEPKKSVKKTGNLRSGKRWNSHKLANRRKKMSGTLQSNSSSKSTPKSKISSPQDASAPEDTSSRPSNISVTPEDDPTKSLHTSQSARAFGQVEGNSTKNKIECTCLLCGESFHIKKKDRPLEGYEYCPDCVEDTLADIQEFSKKGVKRPDIAAEEAAAELERVEHVNRIKNRKANIVNKARSRYHEKIEKRKQDIKQREEQEKLEKEMMERNRELKSKKALEDHRKRTSKEQIDRWKRERENERNQCLENFRSKERRKQESQARVRRELQRQAMGVSAIDTAPVLTTKRRRQANRSGKLTPLSSKNGNGTPSKGQTKIHLSVKVDGRSPSHSKSSRRGTKSKGAKKKKKVVGSRGIKSMEELEHHLSILSADYVPPKPEMSPTKMNGINENDELLADTSDNENAVLPDPAANLSPVNEYHNNLQTSMDHVSPEASSGDGLSAAEVLKKKLDDAERMFASWLE